MEIIRINNNPQTEVINHAVEILKRGGVLVVPTETAYGLAVDATDKKAVEKIYKIKGRSLKKFLPLIVSSLNQIKEYFKVGKKELELLKRYKGLSLALEIKNKEIYLLKNQSSCVVRISTNKAVNLLVKKLKSPITATSANLSGGDNCYSIEEVLKQLNKQKYQPDLILDAGRLKKIKPSTIVSVKGDKVNILRQGEIKI